MVAGIQSVGLSRAALQGAHWQEDRCRKLGKIARFKPRHSDMSYGQPDLIAMPSRQPEYVLYQFHSQVIRLLISMCILIIDLLVIMYMKNFD